MAAVEMGKTREQMPKSGSQKRCEFVDTSCYIYEIPYSLYEAVYTLLDENTPWAQIAKEMQFNELELLKTRQKIRENNKSPADNLLSYWGLVQNHTVTELFMLLNSLQQYEAMNVIKDLVDKRFHRLIQKERPKEQLPLLSSTLATGNGKASMKEQMNIERHLLKLNKAANQIPDIKYDELREATNKWDCYKVLGKGGFGTVYRGLWKCTDVAIKRISYHTASTDSKNKVEIEMKQTMNELNSLNSCRHDNILPLYGYSMDGSEPCLVYQFMPKGSLEKHLKKARENPDLKLKFSIREKIIRGTACGLQYLHTYNKNPLIHGDIKPANILLDANWVPKIGDFGLVREGSNEPIEISKPWGTRPYLPLEYISRHQMSTKVDTYSYGVVLFELLTTLRAHDKNRDAPFLVDYIANKCADRANQDCLDDKSIKDIREKKIYKKLFNLAIQCTNHNVDLRPEMITVYNQLESSIMKCC